MKDYIIFHKSNIDKIGISKTSIFIILLIFLFPFLFLTYLNELELAISVTLFFVFMLLLNIGIMLPSFLKIKYKLKISNDGVSFYLFAPSQGYRFPSYRRYYIQFSNIKNYIIKKQSLIVYYQNNYGLYNTIKKRKIKNLRSENLSEIKNIMSQKIGEKNNIEFKQPVLAWLWQNFHLTLILAMITTIFVAIIYKMMKFFYE
ncbi:MAG: hypothetical protein KAI71_04710 [Candidatus Pacebacteria bacterium]|nr:hypothetical protein [Candidatus Paceibacterota bacterium]